MQRNYLFVGGAKDGELMALPEPLFVVQVAVLDSPTSYHNEAYHRETLRGAGDYLLYRHESLTVDDVMRRLLEHYKPDA